MQTWTRGLLAFGMTLALSAPLAWAQAPAAKPPAPADKPAAAPAADKPGVVIADVAVMTATVEAIDKNKRAVTLKGPAGRMVTLKGPDGNMKTIKVDPRVKKLGEVKVGDEIVLRHTEALAIRVMKPKS